MPGHALHRPGGAVERVAHYRAQQMTAEKPALIRTGAQPLEPAGCEVLLQSEEEEVPVPDRGVR